MMYPELETWKMYRCYKNYYCGTCFALEHNYGHTSRLLLSYDITLVALILMCHPKPLQDKYNCFGQCSEKRCVFCDDVWKQVAAMNILLVNEKLKDDINDDGSIKAKLVKIVLDGKIRKAEREYPDMADKITKGYEEMYILEKQNSDIHQIEDRFALMMVNALDVCKPLTEWEKKYISCVAKWIYYIDALDDYEKDFKKRKFNALKKENADTLYTYIQNYLPEIVSDLDYIYQDIPKLLQSSEEDMIERKILLTMIKYNMVLTTSKVISKSSVRKVKAGSVWGGIRK